MNMILMRSNMRYTACRERRHRGFSTIELMLVVVVGVIIASAAIPKYITLRDNFRTGGDARGHHGRIVMAKMRGASDFTKARVYADLSAQTFRIEVWNKAGTGAWGAEGGTETLSQGVTFGFGSLGSPPSGTQSTIGQAPACLNSSGTAIANTACIVFNSRGIPVDSTGAPTANDAIYVTDSKSVYALTVSATGLILTWRTDAISASWMKR